MVLISVVLSLLSRVAQVGLDNAGKTTTLYHLHMGEMVKTTPTIGSNVRVIRGVMAGHIVRGGMCRHSFQLRSTGKEAQSARSFFNQCAGGADQRGFCQV